MIKYDEKRYETYMQLPNFDEVKKHLELHYGRIHNKIGQIYLAIGYKYVYE